MTRKEMARTIYDKADDLACILRMQGSLLLNLGRDPDEEEQAGMLRLILLLAREAAGLESVAEDLFLELEKAEDRAKKERCGV